MFACRGRLDRVSTITYYWRWLGQGWVAIRDDTIILPLDIMLHHEDRVIRFSFMGRQKSWVVGGGFIGGCWCLLGCRFTIGIGSGADMSGRGLLGSGTDVSGRGLLVNMEWGSWGNTGGWSDLLLGWPNCVDHWIAVPSWAHTPVCLSVHELQLIP